MSNLTFCLILVALAIAFLIWDLWAQKSRDLNEDYDLGHRRLSAKRRARDHDPGVADAAEDELFDLGRRQERLLLWRRVVTILLPLAAVAYAAAWLLIAFSLV